MQTPAMNSDISILLQEVEHKFGRKVKTTTDFEALAEKIGDISVNGRLLAVSASTLKRLWGYVNYPAKPRIDTLSTLAKYIGYNDYESFLTFLRSESGFVGENFLDAAKLDKGDKVRVRWAPDRTVVFECVGDGSFEVTESENSKLMKGDIMKLGILVENSAFYVNEIIRDGKPTAPYYSAMAGGLTEVTKL